MTDDEINYDDIPEFDEAFLKSVEMKFSPGKKQIALRLDTDILEWMQAQGKGYQSRINAVLRAYYEAHQKNPSLSKK
ncbi:MAG: BrnA antitoxin family protein [Nitrospirota bacterium]|nr:BrnA antitoxin family protein [Nitrospirota bacterium]